MAIYRGEVGASRDDDFPFPAVISDETGKVVGEFPVRTEADGQAKIIEVLRPTENHICGRLRCPEALKARSALLT